MQRLGHACHKVTLLHHKSNIMFTYALKSVAKIQNTSLSTTGNRSIGFFRITKDILLPVSFVKVKKYQ